MSDPVGSLEPGLRKRLQDLEWVLSAPPLLDPSFPRFEGRCVTQGFSCALLEQGRSVLSALALDPSPLRTWVEQKRSQRLGVYFETLVEFWLRHLPDFELLHAHLTLERNKRTLGEFDFLFHDRRRERVVHWETAIKFYMQLEGQDGWDSFVGPSIRDRLSDKIHKIFHTQLCYGKDFPVSTFLPEPLRRLPFHTETFFKGYLFFPLVTFLRGETHLPMGLAKEGLKGWWSRLSGFADFRFGPGSRFVILQKFSWLSPARLLPFGETHTQSEVCAEIEKKFKSDTYACLLAVLQENSGHWHEVSRGFVVPNPWPGV